MLVGFIPQVANLFGLACSALIGLIGNTKFSFSHKNPKNSFRLHSRFLSVTVLSVVLSQFLAVVAFNFVDANDLIAVNIAKVAVIGFMLVFRFLALKYFVY